MRAGPDDPGQDVRRYRSLVQAFSTFVWMTTPDGRLKTDMPAWRRVTGQSREELLDFGWLEGVHPEDRDRVVAVWEEAVGTRSLYEAEYRIVGPDGQAWLECRAAPVLSDDGEVLEWVGTAVDTTARHEAQEGEERMRLALRAERATLDKVLDQVPVAMAVLWGPDHTYRFFNERYLDLVPAGRIAVGRTVREALPEAEEVLPVLDRVRRRGEPLRSEEIAVAWNADDPLAFEGRRYYDVTYAPVVEEDGQVAGIVVVATDVTESVRLRSDLRRQLQEERRIAVGLQRALLPDRLDELPGIETAVRYAPAGGDVGVGGDWYDAVVLPDGRVLLVIGDVCGRGLDAATVMSQVRAAVRAFAFRESDPGALLGQTALYCTQLGLPDMITIGVGLLSPASGTFAYATAGHLPPLLVRPDGEPEFLAQIAGPPVGLGIGAYRTVEVELPPGTAIVLYTDGLVEERGRSLDESLDLLRRRAAGDTAADALCARIRDDAGGAGGGDDDVAYMVARLLPDPAGTVVGTGTRRDAGVS